MSRHTADQNRLCTIYDANSPTGQCQGKWFCRRRCFAHYMSLRRAELEGRAAEIQKLEPERPKWSWPGDEQWLIERLEKEEEALADRPEQQESSKESTEGPHE